MRKLHNFTYLFILSSIVFLCSCNASSSKKRNHSTTEISTSVSSTTSDSKPQTFTVNFDSRGGTPVQSQIVSSGGKVIKPSDPTKDGYEFINWVDSDNNQWLFTSYQVFENMTLFASWRDVREFDVSFVNNDGSLLYKTTAHYGDYVIYPYANPEAKNKDQQYFYTFIGWDKSLLITSDTILTAQYSMEKVSKLVYYYDYDDSLLAMYQLRDGESTSYKGETPTRPFDSSLQLQYCFHQWLLKEKNDNTEVYYADYASCTIGLDFEDNVVTRYHGVSTDVVVPSFWNGSDINIIGESCFSGTHIQKVTLSESIVSLYTRSFHSCSSLTEILMPSSLKSIGPESFSNCSSLKTINIPNGVLSLGWYAFGNCSSLLSVTLPDTLKTIGGVAFQNCPFTSITIPDSVTEIGDSAFIGCNLLKSIALGRAVTIVGESVFAQCSALLTAFIPISVTTMGYNVFHSCTSVTIYCEAQSKPSGWNANWNPYNRPVVWGYTPS